MDEKPVSKAERFKYWIAGGTVLGAIVLGVVIFLIVHFTTSASVAPTPTPTNTDIPPVTPVAQQTLAIDLGGVSALYTALVGAGVVFAANHVHDNFQTTLPSSVRLVPLTAGLAQFNETSFLTYNTDESKLQTFVANSATGQIDSLTTLPEMAIDPANFTAGSFGATSVVVSLVNNVQTMKLEAWNLQGAPLADFDLSPSPSAASLFLPVMCSSQQSALTTCVVDVTQKVVFIATYGPKQQTEVLTLDQTPRRAALSANGKTLVVISERSVYFVLQGSRTPQRLDMNFALRDVCVSQDGSRFAVSTDQTSVVLGKVGGAMVVYQPSFRDTNGPLACATSGSQTTLVQCDSRVAALLARFNDW